MNSINASNPIKRVLTIAGSDSGGGAGIQADLKTFTALGDYGLSVITAVTSQNTKEVTDIHPVPKESVRKQLDAVLSDIGSDAVKIGMLFNRETVEVVAETIKRYKLKNVVLDTVMVAKSKAKLLNGQAIDTIVKKLFPLTILITPNIFEAEILTGLKIKNIDDMKKSAVKLSRMNAKNVLIKGGHLKGGDCTDLLFDGKKFTLLPQKRIKTKNTHGTGCTYSSAIASYLAKGEKLESAVKKAQSYLNFAIKYSLNLGKGHGPVNHMFMLQKNKKLSLMQKEMILAFEKLKKEQVGNLIPEVQSNMAYAMENADKLNEVLGFPGRIIRIGKDIRILDTPVLSGSAHMGKVVLTALKYNPFLRAGMNIKFSSEIIEVIKKLKFTYKEFDRKKEPAEFVNKEGKTLEWGAGSVIKKTGFVPDIIFDRGGIGKEPMIRVLGKNPGDVAKKIIAINKELKGKNY